MPPEWGLALHDRSSSLGLTGVVSDQGLLKGVLCHLQSGAPQTTQACSSTLDTQVIICSGPPALLCSTVRSTVAPGKTDASQLPQATYVAWGSNLHVTGETSW